MSLKRALVVDDSKVARVTLKSQLEGHGLQVELAESGEAALELLQTHMVDVIFMDHVMPGMDGLEAMTLIKSNPLTATIPVMMYTSKEGEVYVSEARALGAVGVLPKQVQPGVLFDMLLKLGLVRDRRAKAGDDIIDATAEDVIEIVENRGGPAPVGFEVSALLSRMLEDQHSELRSDIRSSYQRFAKQVANEVHNQLQEQHELEKLEEELDHQRGSVWQVMTGVLAVAVLLLGTLFLQARSERDAVRDDLADVAVDLERARRALALPNESPATDSGSVSTQAEFAYRLLLDSMIRAVNEAGAIPYEERPFNDSRIDQISELLWQLSEVGFQGTVRIESHLGEFCLVSDAAGIYHLQGPDTPFISCSFIGHPLDDSKLLSDRQTPSFEIFRATSPWLDRSGIELDIILRDRTDTWPRIPYPDNPVTAGDWNRVAAQNNRLEYSLLSAALE